MDKNRIYVRAGILPYSIIDGKYYFGIGLDARYHELTDFGGRCSFFDSDHLSTAIREYVEETNAPPLFKDKQPMRYCDNENNTSTNKHILYMMEVEPYILTNYIQYASNREISKTFIVDIDILYHLIAGGAYKGYKLWHVLSKMLNQTLTSSKLMNNDNVHLIEVATS